MTAKSVKKKKAPDAKRYEKDRRDRFTTKLTKLAEMLPKFDKENPWSRLEILENTIQYILYWQQDNTRNEDLMKRLLLEIKHLKEIIYAFTEFKYQKYNIFKLSSVEIKLILKQLSDHNRLLCDTSGNKESSAAVDYNDDTIDTAAAEYQQASTQQPQPLNDMDYTSLNQSIEIPTKAKVQTPVVQIVQEKPVLVSPSAATDKPVVTSPIIKLAPETPKPVLHQLNVQTLRTQTNNGQTTSFLVKDNNITSIEVLPINNSTRIENNVSTSPTTSLHKLPENTIMPELVTSLTSTSTVSSSVLSNLSAASIMTPSTLHNSYISTLHLQTPRRNNGDKKHIFIAPKPVSVAVVRPLNGQQAGQGVLLGTPMTQGLVAVSVEGGGTVYSLIPVSQLNTNPGQSLTSTVTCNTKLKVSVPAVSETIQKKRPYRKRKHATSTNKIHQSKAKTQTLATSEVHALSAANVEQPTQVLTSQQIKHDPQFGVDATIESQQLLDETGISDLGTVDVNEGDTSKDLIGPEGEAEEPLSKVSRLTNIESDSDNVEISDIVENLTRLENNEELNIIQETITEDSQTNQNQEDSLPSILTEESICPETQQQINQANNKKEIGEEDRIELRPREDNSNRVEEGGDNLAAAILEEKGEAILKKKERGEKKRSKNSYSIPALCQISVNIGERPDVSNSPGVFSLNSVGTISPTHTPVPTPDNKPSTDSKNPDDHVIEELKTFRPEELLNQDTVDGVTMQIEISQALKDLDRELNLDNIPTDDQTIKDIKIDGRGNKTDDPSVQSSCLPSDNQNVYEFTEKPATPPPPLSKTRKDSKSPRHPRDDAKQKQIIEKESKSKNQGQVNQDRKGSTMVQPQHTSHLQHDRKQVAVAPAGGGQVMFQSGPGMVGLATPDRKSGMLQQDSGDVGGYSVTEAIDQSLAAYDTRIHNQHLSGGSNNMKQVAYSSHNPAAYHSSAGVQQSVQRNSYMNYHYQTLGAGTGNSSSLPHSASASGGAGNISGGGQVGGLPGTGVPTAPGGIIPPGSGVVLPQESVNSGGGNLSNISDAIVNHQQHLTNYTHYAHDASDMKSSVGGQSYSCGSQAVYPPANIQDFHSRSYYKSYSSSHHQYRGFQNQAPDQMNQYVQDRKHRQHHNIHNQNVVGMVEKSNVESETGGAATFSVTQLVNTPAQQQRASKATKKTGSASTKSTKKESADKREGRGEERKGKATGGVTNAGGSAGGSRRSRSGGGGGGGSRSTYSTESLLQANMDPHAKPEEEKHKNSPYKNTSSSMKDKSVRSSGSNWSNEMNQHFNSLSFTSLSPSPGLFSTDLSSFEFGILNPQDPSLGGRDYLPVPTSSARDYLPIPTSSARDYLPVQVSSARDYLPVSASSARDYLPISSSSGSQHKLNSKQHQQLACQLSAQSVAANQRMQSAVPSGADWTTGGIIDGSFLPPLPSSLTPPTDDPMAYTFMPHSHSGFYSSSCAPSVTGQKGQNIYTPQSSHHIPVSGFSSSMMGKVHQNFGGGHMGSSVGLGSAGSISASIPGINKGASNTGSLVNFNLSTIFPEINIAPVPAGPNCQTKPLVGLPPLPPPEFLQGSRSSSSQLGTPDLIPSHSIPILGHTSQVVTSFSVAPPGLSTNIVHGLPFTNIHE